MFTRVAFGTLATVAAQIWPLIGPSFQGFKDVKRNKRKFMSLNVGKLIAGYKANSNDYYAAPKGQGILVPGAYVISQGNLLMPGVLQPTTNSSDEVATVFIDDALSNDFDLTTYTAAELWRMLFATDATQITSVAIVQPDVNAIMYSNDEDTDFCRYSEMRAVRIKLVNPDDTITLTSSTTQAVVSAFIAAHFMTTSAVQSILFADLTVTQHAASGDAAAYVTIAMDGTELTPRVVFGLDEDGQCKAIGNFISKWDDNSKMWKYSSCKMSVYGSTIANGAARSSSEWGDSTVYGAAFEGVLPTYVKASGTSSKYFTQEGGTEQSIPSFQ